VIKVRRLHRWIGIVLLLPFLGWAATALVFFFKPGYGPAYEGLAVKLLPLGEVQTPVVDPLWLEYRLLRTILGHHLLVRTAEGPQHLHLDGSPWQPGTEDVRRLLTDATEDKPRYGDLQEVAATQVTTSTGVVIQVNWERMSLYQMGNDTRLIDRIYKVHYLQLTGWKTFDQVTGVVGLALLVLMAITGCRLLLRPNS